MELVRTLNDFNVFATHQVDQFEIHRTEKNRADDAQKAIGGKAVVKIVEGGSVHTIERSVEDRVWFTGRDENLKANNNRARKLFLKAVLDQFGGKWENVPQSVRDQLELGDYKTAGKKSMLEALDAGRSIDELTIDSGKPLTARRIKAVIAAIETAAEKAIKTKTPQEVAALFLEQMRLSSDDKLKPMKMQNLLGAFFDKCIKFYERNIRATGRNDLRKMWIAFAMKMVNKDGSDRPAADQIEVIVGGKDDKTSMTHFLELLTQKITIVGFGRQANQAVDEIRGQFAEFIEGLKASFIGQRKAIEKQLETQFLGDLKAYYAELDEVGGDNAEEATPKANSERKIREKYEGFPDKLAAARKLFGDDFLAWIDHPLAKGQSGNGAFLEGKTPLEDALDFRNWHTWKFYLREQAMWPQDEPAVQNAQGE